MGSSPTSGTKAKKQPKRLLFCFEVRVSEKESYCPQDNKVRWGGTKFKIQTQNTGIAPIKQYHNYKHLINPEVVNIYCLCYNFIEIQDNKLME